jgi:hypothetical protein
MNTDYVFFQRMVMGVVDRPKAEVQKSILNLAASPRWAGPRYDLTQRNCNHFASDAIWMLVKKRPPEWINKTAEGIAQQTRVSAALTHYAAEALYGYTVAMAPNQNIYDSPDEIPGETAFRSTFTSTFNMAWERQWESGKHRIAECPETEDLEEVKAELEKYALEFAAAASEAAAWAVAEGARRARVARLELLATGRPGVAAWDEAWRNASAPLVSEWREQALLGLLKLEHIRRPGVPDEDRKADQAEKKRMTQVEDALAVAAAAQQKAALEADAATAADPSLDGYHQ